MRELRDGIGVLIYSGIGFFEGIWAIILNLSLTCILAEVFS